MRSHEGHEGFTKEHCLFPIIAHDKTLNAIFQMYHVEINQQAQVLAAQLDVRKSLGMMYRSQCLNALHFYHHQILNQQVNPVTDLHLCTVEENWDRNLCLYTKASVAQFLS